MKYKGFFSLFLVTSMVLNFSACMLQSSKMQTEYTAKENNIVHENVLEENNMEKDNIQGTTDNQETSTSETEPKDNIYYQEKYGKYLEHFFLLFSDQFDSVLQLNQESVLFFTLIEMIDEYPQEEIPFEYNLSLDVYYVPRLMLKEKVEQYFGIHNFDFVDTDRYSHEKDSYAYTFAHGYPILYPQIVSTDHRGSQVIFEVVYTNPEMEGNPTTQLLLFTFDEIRINGKDYLQAISAKYIDK